MKMDIIVKSGWYRKKVDDDYTLIRPKKAL